MQLAVHTERPGSNGGLQSFTLTYRLQFAEAGRGLRLTATLLRLERPAKGGAGPAMTDLLAPLVGRPMDFLLGKDGQDLMLHDGDALWAAVERDLRDHSIEAPVAEGRELAQLLIRLPPASREDLLAADIRQMLRFAGQAWAPSFTIAAPPGPAPQPGDCRLVTLVDATRAAASGARAADDRQIWQIDRATGLVREHRNEIWQAPGDGQTPQLVARTRRTLTPE